MAENKFVALDYVVFSLCLVVSAGIGVFYACTGGKQKTTDEFLMADRNMKIFPVSLSLLASFMSAITLLGTPAETYTYGMMYIWIVLSYVFVIFLSAHIFIPVFFRLRVTSAYEYLELRFNRKVRVAGACIFSLQMVLYMSIVLYAPALALNAVTGLNVWISVMSVGLVCTFYTALGGMKAVMWTDVFQIFMMFAGLLAVLIQGSIEEGGVARVWEIATNSGRIDFYNVTMMFDPNPAVRHTFWSLGIGGIFTWTAIYGVNQAQVQRALSVPKLRHAQIAMWVNLPGLALLALLCAFCGLVIYANYKDCDPILNQEILSNDQLFPLFVMEILSFLPGIPGLFVACLFSGALSTISSGLNSLAAVALTDLIKVYIKPDITEERATLVSKILAIVYGLICIALTFVAAQLGGVLQAALALFGMIGGPLLGLFTLGMLFPWANWKGALTGLAAGLGLSFWIGIGAQIIPPQSMKYPVSVDGCPVDNETLYNATSLAMTTLTEFATTVATTTTERPAIAQLYTLSYMWYSATGVATVVVVGLLVSLCTGYTRPDEVDGRLIVPIFEIIFPCLPEKWLRKLRCGVIHKEDSDIKKTMSETPLKQTSTQASSMSKFSTNSLGNGKDSYDIPQANFEDTIDDDNVRIELKDHSRLTNL